MKLLLDTHVLLWALSDDKHLTDQARFLIENADNSICYSIVSPWEVEIKRIAHPDKMAFGADEVVAYCKESGVWCLPIKLSHVDYLSRLQRKEGAAVHRDPFDRMLICQAAVEGMMLVTADEKLAGYTDSCILKV